MSNKTRQKQTIEKIDEGSRQNQTKKPIVWPSHYTRDSNAILMKLHAIEIYNSAIYHHYLHIRLGFDVIFHTQKFGVILYVRI